MIRSRHALIGAVLFAAALARPGAVTAPWLCAADDNPAAPTANSRLTPPVGAWRLSGESSSGKRLSATLVVLRNEASRLEGYIRWKSPGELSAIEVFRGECDASGRVTLEGFEVLTQRTRVGVGAHRATFDAETRELRHGVSTPSTPAGVVGQWTASYVGDPPSTLPKMMNLPPAEGRWPTLCRNLSEGFARGRIGHWHFPRTDEISELLNADDDRLTRLATLRRAQRSLEQFANSGLTSLSEADTSNVDDAMPLLRELYPLEDGRVVNLPEPLQQIIHATSATRGRGADAGDKMTMRALEGLVSSSLRAQLIDVAAPMRRRSEMRESDIRARCRPATEGGLVARVTNKSGRDLRRCLIVTQFHVDPQAVEDASRQASEQKLAQATIARWLGQTGRTGRSNAQPLEYYWAVESLDKGSICYLESWPDERTIDVDLAPAPCHCIEGTVARVYVFSSDGSMTVNIDKPSLQTAFAESRLKSRTSVATKSKSKTRRTRRRAPS
ncbi:MAG TPA: hypothetical protein P5081_01560 [Phycisphaerae bacterium]|nr:hypothetical protein [Phycisphaerae bacterium]HRW51542.1 hypothetical protein [Phycisphaerae bacterium]